MYCTPQHVRIYSNSSYTSPFYELKFDNYVTLVIDFAGLEPIFFVIKVFFDYLYKIYEIKLKDTIVRCLINYFVFKS